MSVNCLEVISWVAEVCVSLNSVDLSLNYEGSQVNWVTMKASLPVQDKDPSVLPQCPLRSQLLLTPHHC